MSNARIAGVGMVKFCKPGQQEPYRVMASAAIKASLQDTNIDLTPPYLTVESHIEVMPLIIFH